MCMMYVRCFLSSSNQLIILVRIWLQRRVLITIGGGVRKQQHVAAGTLSMVVLLSVIVRKQRHGHGFGSKQTTRLWCCFVLLFNFAK